ncbi:MAG: cupin domain-containing protein [Vicinamibacterales bacterium]
MMTPVGRPKSPRPRGAAIVSPAPAPQLQLAGRYEKSGVFRVDRTTPLACGSEGTATLLQLNQPLAAHSHDDAEEFLYVVAGEGSASVEGRQEQLRAGILVFGPRATPHALAPTGRNPLIVLSTRAGEPCSV